MGPQLNTPVFGSGLHGESGWMVRSVELCVSARVQAAAAAAAAATAVAVVVVVVVVVMMMMEGHHNEQAWASCQCGSARGAQTSPLLANRFGHIKQAQGLLAGVGPLVLGNGALIQPEPRCNWRWRARAG